MKLNNKGFSLVEVLAVIVILGVICGIAANRVLSAIESSKDASYNILISNIKTASITLYEELENKRILGSNVNIYNYKLDGTMDSNPLEINKYNSSIIINLQTLVSNGFLVGVNNECSNVGCSNRNEKVILNPKNNVDIGACRIKIVKSNFSYTITNYNNNSNCPSDADYRKKN